MFKTIKFLAISAVALLTACCNSDNGGDNGGRIPQQGFHVSLSADTIYANGTDVAQFSAYYNGVALTAEEVKVYNVLDGVESEEESTSIKNLQLCTTIPGEYNFVLVYTTEEEEHKSEVFTVYVIAEANVETIPGEKGMTVRTTTSLLSVGESVTFVVRYDGEVLPSLNGVTLIDATSNKTLTTGTKVVTATDGTPYTLLTYTPTQAGSYSVAVNGGPLYGTSYSVSFKVVDYEIPTRPADSKPASTSFKRRSLIMQFTGLNCGACPYVRTAMESVFAKDKYKDTAVHTAIHCATYSPDRTFVIWHEYDKLDLASALGVNSFPTYWVDWVHQNSNKGLNDNIKNIEKYLDEQQNSPAKAGIAARMMWKRNTLIVRVSVKAATDGDFYVGAWLLENGLKGTQAGSTNPEHMIHNNVVRIADSHAGGGNWNYFGRSLGTLSKGDVTDYLFEMELKDGWAASNCHLALFVSYYDSKSKSIEVTNAVETKSLTSGVSFQYAE